MKEFKATKYKLQTVSTGRIFEDDNWNLSDPQAPTPSLIRSIYDKKQIELRDKSYGFYQFADWLPISRVLKNSSSPITYKSKGLASFIGLDNLYITFSGYWPEIGANMSTCSFKETEAYSVCARLKENEKRILVVASAGNTARAFARVCSDNNIPLLLSVPADNLDALWFKDPISDCVKVIASPRGSDYYDSIHLASIIASEPEFLEEGGAKNVARRDGMGTTVLSAATFIGRTPDAYFQAIGSGTGTIAAWEANLRLIEDGRFGNHVMRLYPSQNIPFTPMYDAFKADSRQLFPMEENEARKMALMIDAKVLSNRRPPYSLAGGVYDAVKYSKGDMEIANNSDICTQSELFKKLEGIDIHPAAAVAITGMMNSFTLGKIKKEDIVMLNVTGGGEQLLKSKHKSYNIEPNLILDPNGDKDLIIKNIKSLFF
jgi:cysteate synthase